MQARLAAGEEWILDGDLGPYDVLDVRLRRADSVVLLDYSLPRCAWRAVRRGRERADFWRWVVAYRWRHRPAVLATVAVEMAADLLSMGAVKDGATGSPATFAGGRALAVEVAGTGASGDERIVRNQQVLRKEPLAERV